jgi:hypothetical protein
MSPGPASHRRTPTHPAGPLLDPLRIVSFVLVTLVNRPRPPDPLSPASASPRRPPSSAAAPQRDAAPAMAEGRADRL